MVEQALYREITWNIDIGDISELGYGMIISRDLMNSLGLTIDLKHKALGWDKKNNIKFSNNNRTEDSTKCD